MNQTMNPTINDVKTAKEIATRMLKRLERNNTNISYELMLEALSAGYQHRDWNTFSANLKSNTQLNKSHLETDWMQGVQKALSIKSPKVFQKKPIDNNPEIIISPDREGRHLVLPEFKVDLSRELPEIGVIDASGKAIKWLVDLASRLSKEQQKDISYITLENDTKINPFDTLLGCREPLPHQREALVNLMLVMVSDMLPTYASYEARTFIDIMVSEMYELASKSSFSYREGMDSFLDEKIIQYGIIYLPSTSWWNIVDSFFEKGHIELAKRAQAYAVPCLVDSNLVIDLNRKHKNYPELITFATEFLKVFNKTYQDSMGKYMGRTSPTIALKRISVVDIRNLIPRYTTQGKQVAIAYMLARKLVSEDKLHHYDDIQYIPERYQDYHHCILASNGSRQIVYNDAQMATYNETVKSQLEQDVKTSLLGNAKISFVFTKSDFGGNIPFPETSKGKEYIFKYILNSGILDRDVATIIEKVTNSEQDKSELRSCYHKVRTGSETLMLKISKNEFHEISHNLMVDA